MLWSARITVQYEGERSMSSLLSWAKYCCYDRSSIDYALKAISGTLGAIWLNRINGIPINMGQFHGRWTNFGGWRRRFLARNCLLICFPICSLNFLSELQAGNSLNVSCYSQIMNYIIFHNIWTPYEAASSLKLKEGWPMRCRESGRFV